LSLGKAKELVDGGDGAIDESWGLGRESEVERKLEFAADGGDAANDIGAVNGTSVSGVSGAMDCFHEDLVGASIVVCDSDTAIENTKETLEAHAFVVATSSRVEF
jgi:hypothetical protein